MMTIWLYNLRITSLVLLMMFLVLITNHLPNWFPNANNPPMFVFQLKKPTMVIQHINHSWLLLLWRLT